MKKTFLVDKHGYPVIHAVFAHGWSYYPGYHSFIGLMYYLPLRYIHAFKLLAGVSFKNFLRKRYKQIDRFLVLIIFLIFAVL